MASSDEFDIKIEGVGGHAAMPHKCVGEKVTKSNKKQETNTYDLDSIYVGSLLVQAMQGIVSRENDPAEPLVISITKFIGNSGAYNVIPSSVVLSGTLRCFSPIVRANVMERMKALVASFSVSYNVNSSLAFHEFGYPPTINDEEATRLAKLAAIETVGKSICYLFFKKKLIN